jgi:hypothetical protein
MASQLGCDLCGQENAILMQTNIGNGDVIAIGPSCVVVFMLTTAESIISEMPEANAAAYGEALAPIVARLAPIVDRAAKATMGGSAATVPEDGRPADWRDDQDESDAMHAAALKEADESHAGHA